MGCLGNLIWFLFGGIWLGLGDLKTLYPDRNAYNRQAPQASNQRGLCRKQQAAGYQPEDIQQHRPRSPAIPHLFPKGKKTELRELKALYAHRDSHNG